MVSIKWSFKRTSKASSDQWSECEALVTLERQCWKPLINHQKAWKFPKVAPLMDIFDSSFEFVCYQPIFVIWSPRAMRRNFKGVRSRGRSRALKYLVQLTFNSDHENFYRLTFLRFISFHTLILWNSDEWISFLVEAKKRRFPLYPLYKGYVRDIR